MVDNYKYQHSHLLQLIYEAHKDGLIDQFEKIKIKELVLSQNPELNSLYEEYDKTKDSMKFIQALKDLSSLNLNPNNEEDQQKIKELLSSPEDSRLVKKKRAKAKQAEVKAPQMFGSSVQECEEGLSPKVTFTKKKFNYEDSDDDDAESDD